MIRRKVSSKEHLFPAAVDILLEQNLKFEIFESAAQLNSIRNEWNQLSVHPNTDIDAFIFNCANVAKASSPFVVACRIQGSIVAILPCRLELSNLTYRIGYKTIGGPLMRQLVVTYPGVIGLDDESTARGFGDVIKRKIDAKELDAMLFYSTPVKSSLIQAFDAGILPKGKMGPRRLSDHWRVALPSGGVDEFIQKLGSKHRYWMRRLPRILEKDFPGDVCIKIFTGEDDVDTLSETCESIAKNTYHRAAGVGFRDTKYWRDKFSILAKKGALRGYIIYLKEEPAAFWVATLYGGTLYLDFTGYLPKYKKYELGTQLFLRMIDDSIGAGANILDYGLGALWYKERFGGESWSEATFYIFSPTLRGRLSFVLVRFIGAAHKLLRFTMGGNEGIRRFMKVWREKLSGMNVATRQDS